MENNEDRRRKIAELESRIDSLKMRMPAHSVPVSMMQELEDLEEELAKMNRNSTGRDQDAHL